MHPSFSGSWSRIVCALVTLAALVAGCRPLTPLTRLKPEVSTPTAYTLYEAGEAYPDRWWRVFDAPELERLIATALTDDFSIRAAWSRLRRAKAEAMQTGAGTAPELSLDTGFSAQRRRLAERTTAGETYALGLAAAYELDWWGRIRSEQEAAQLEVQAAAADIHTAAMTVAAEVATNWIQLITQQAHRRLLQAQIETSETYLELIQLRFQKGMVSALDVYQQQQVVEQLQSRLPLVNETEAKLHHRMALLLGRTPGAPISVSRDTLPELPPQPAAGIPADLLARRPDVRAAGSRLRAADWQEAAARANRLPSLTLSGTAGFSSARVDRLLEDWLMRLAANLTTPLYDGKRRRAAVDRRRAMVDEALWTYRQTVYRAIGEVQDALASEAARQEHIATLKGELETSRVALEQALLRYRKGLNTYLPVLTQITLVQRLEQDLISRQAELLENRIALYRALGGAWTDRLPDGGSDPPNAEREQ